MRRELATGRVQRVVVARSRRLVLQVQVREEIVPLQVSFTSLAQSALFRSFVASVRGQAHVHRPSGAVWVVHVQRSLAGERPVASSTLKLLLSDRRPDALLTNGLGDVRELVTGKVHEGEILEALGDLRVARDSPADVADRLGAPVAIQLPVALENGGAVATLRDETRMILVQVVLDTGHGGEVVAITGWTAVLLRQVVVGRQDVIIVDGSHLPLPHSNPPIGAQDNATFVSVTGLVLVVLVEIVHALALVRVVELVVLAAAGTRVRRHGALVLADLAAAVSIALQVDVVHLAEVAVQVGHALARHLADMARRNLRNRHLMLVDHDEVGHEQGRRREHLQNDSAEKKQGNPGD